jgi:hypothetical protein
MERSAQQGKRDLHTGRMVQISALRSLLYAERASEHPLLYEEDIEAVFWRDVKECTALCKEPLTDEPRRQAIAQRGHERALKNNHFNELVMAKIFYEALQVFREKR